MILESCNIWGGRRFEALIEHLKSRSSQVDIFCFQEVYNTPTDRTYTTNATDGSRADLYQQLAQALPDFVGYFRSAQEGFDYFGKVDYPLEFGLATFIRKNIKVCNETEIFVYRERNSKVAGDNSTFGRNLQIIELEVSGKKYAVANFHGLWNGKGKTDSEERIEQSQKIKRFLDGIRDAKILIGDFNLLPQTESLKILEQGMKNLIVEYKITNTRSKVYQKPDRFADYALVSPEIEVINFQVLTDEISDHLPLLLEFK